MKTFIIDTSTVMQYMALVEDDKILGVYQEERLNNHSHSLMENFSNLLIKTKTDIKEIDNIICGIGPGSFTGSRICVTIAKILAYTNNCALKKISSLFLMSSGYQEKIMPIIDAKREYYFCALIENGNVILEDGMRLLKEIEKIDEYQKITEKEFKADPLKIIKYAKEADCFSLEPNYIKEV